MAGEFPLKGASDDFEVPFELPKRVGHLVRGLEIVWRQHLPLDDREVNFDLIEPTPVNRPMDQLQARIALLEPSHTGKPSMGRTIVDDPEDPARLSIRSLGHDPVDQLVKRSNPALSLAMAEKLGAMNIHGRQVSNGSTPFVLVFDLHGFARLGWLAGMNASSGLNAGFFVRRNHELVLLQGLALPGPLVKIQQPSGFGGKVRIPGKDPTTMKPGANGIFMQPAPKSRVTDFGHQPGLTDLLGQFGQAPARQRQAQLFGQFASPSLNLHDHFWGEKPGGDPGGAVLPARLSAGKRTAYAIG